MLELHLLGIQNIYYFFSLFKIHLHSFDYYYYRVDLFRVCFMSENNAFMVKHLHLTYACPVGLLLNFV